MPVRVSPISANLASKVSKGEIVLSVKDFEAKGDGSTDDTTAITTELGLFPRVCGTLGSQSDLPTTITDASLGTTSNIAYMALY